MPELRKDPITGTWVIISEERKKRPKYYQIVVNKDMSIPQNCPFCPGNEAMTPPETYALRPDHSPANGPGWNLRVVPNKFPALRIEGELRKSGEGFYDKISGIGAHEVIIETSQHPEERGDIGSIQIQNTLSAARYRIMDLKKDTRFKYIMVFKNFGPTAGATLAHSHSQIVALPVVPLRVQEEIDGAQAHFDLKERCIFCDIIQYESEADRRLLMENEHFIVLAPYAPRFSFELAVYPKRHNPAFESTPDVELESLSSILSETLNKISRLLNHPDYNLIIHNAPCQNNVGDFYHWHIEFMPVLSRVAGFEWGTGFYINPISPEESVQSLKAV
ncbi:MAG: galactose-1-phosphate uridylyltransferase [Candidatus Aminicenantes bacterium]|nr:galactose-1-phosphate uridylyltransferase [Candidatus Aminicenantes bacterium]